MRVSHGTVNLVLDHRAALLLNLVGVIEVQKARDEAVAFLFPEGKTLHADPYPSVQRRSSLSDRIKTHQGGFKSWTRHTIMSGEVRTYARDFTGDGTFPDGADAVGPFEISASREGVMVHHAKVRSKDDFALMQRVLKTAWLNARHLEDCDGRPDSGDDHTLEAGDTADDVTPTATQSAPQAAVDAWNDRYPIGTPVRYWTGVREGEGKKAVTRAEACVLSGHTAVVFLEGVSGCVALSHVEYDHIAFLARLAASQDVARLERRCTLEACDVETIKAKGYLRKGWTAGEGYFCKRAARDIVIHRDSDGAWVAEVYTGGRWKKIIREDLPTITEDDIDKAIQERFGRRVMYVDTLIDLIDEMIDKASAATAESATPTR